MSFYHLSRNQAAEVLAAKLAEIQCLLDDCVGLAEAHDMEFSFEIGQTSVTRRTYGEVDTWVNSEEEWKESNWADSNC